MGGGHREVSAVGAAGGIAGRLGGAEAVLSFTGEGTGGSAGRTGVTAR